MVKNDPLLDGGQSYDGPSAKPRIAARQPVPPEKLELKRLIFPAFILVFLLITLFVIFA